MGHPLDPAEMQQLVQRLSELRQAHRALDTAIAQTQACVPVDDLQLKRMKKRKLQLKDQIAWIENRLIPDEPA